MPDKEPTDAERREANWQNVRNIVSQINQFLREKVWKDNSAKTDTSITKPEDRAMEPCSPSDPDDTPSLWRG